MAVLRNVMEELTRTLGPLRKNYGIGREELIYNITSEVQKKHEIVQKGINIQLLISRDLMVTGKVGPKKILTGALYLPYDSPESLPNSVAEVLRSRQITVIIGCDDNAHHLTCGTSIINEWQHLLQFIMTNNLDILNLSNKPIFIKTNICKYVTLGNIKKVT